jgi:hypothetical protein
VSEAHGGTATIGHGASVSISLPGRQGVGGAGVLRAKRQRRDGRARPAAAARAS